VATARGRKPAATDDQLCRQLRLTWLDPQSRTSYLTFGDLVAMVLSDQMDEWRAVLAKARAADAARDAEEDRD
jgi:hypothetical protein